MSDYMTDGTGIRIAQALGVDATQNPGVPAGSYIREGTGQKILEGVQQIGDLDDLTTVDKTNLVAAINEIGTGQGASGVVHFDTAQEMTTAQQGTARANIEAIGNQELSYTTGNVPFGGSDGSATNRNLTITRVGQRYTVSRTAAASHASDFSLMPAVNAENANSGGANFTAWCGASTFKLTPGKKYRLEARIVSGAFPTNGTFSVSPRNETATVLSNDSIRFVAGMCYQDFVFSGTYFAVMVYADGGFYTGSDTPLVFDLFLREIDEDTYLGGPNSGKIDGVSWLVDHGTRPYKQTTTRDGLTCTVHGNRVILNGTNGNTSAMRFRLSGVLATKAGSMAASSTISTGVMLKAGRQYRFCGRLISGTYTMAEGSDSGWIFHAYKVGTTTPIFSDIVRDGAMSIRQGTVDADTEISAWISCVSGDSFSNTVIEVWIEELTQDPNADCAIEITGTDPVIVARQNKRYTCGTLSTLDFTPCAFGSCEVIFTSGTSATVLTVPSGIKWPDWFDPTSLETNRIYDIIITDDVYGAVTSWAAT